MDRVIEILNVILMEAERDIAQAAINIAHIVEDHTLDVLAFKREPQFDVVNEQRITAERESGRLRGRAARHKRGADVARAGLIEGEGAQGVRASRIEPLGKRHRFLGVYTRGRGEGFDNAELGLTRQNQILAKRVISGVAEKGAAKAPLGSEEFAAELETCRVVHAAMWIGRIIAAILNEICPENPQPDGFKELGNQKYWDNDVADGVLAIRGLKYPSQRFRKSFGELHGRVPFAGGKCAHIQRIVI